MPFERSVHVDECLPNRDLAGDEIKPRASESEEFTGSEARVGSEQHPHAEPFVDAIRQKFDLVRLEESLLDVIALRESDSHAWSRGEKARVDCVLQYACK